jgi:hypothetical protein
MTFHEGEPTDAQFDRNQSGAEDIDPVDSSYRVDGITADDGNEADIDDDLDEGDEQTFTKYEYMTDEVVATARDFLGSGIEPSSELLQAPDDVSKIIIDVPGLTEPLQLRNTEGPTGDPDADAVIRKYVGAAMEQAYAELPPPDLQITGLSAAAQLESVTSKYLDKTLNGGLSQHADPPNPELQESIDHWAGDAPAEAAADPTREFMDFRQPFDGMQPEVPLAERKAAGALLASYLKDRLDGGFTGIAGTYVNCPYNDETLRFGVEPDMDEVIHRGDVLPPSEVKGTVSVRQYFGPGELGEGSAYQIMADGTARRIDHRTLTEDERTARDAAAAERPRPRSWSELTDEEKLVDAVTIIAKTRNTLANIRMEQTMGLNAQPVGPQEVARFIQFVERLRRHDYRTDIDQQ